ncbi:MAG: ferritin family protein [Bacteroidales bacterium]
MKKFENINDILDFAINEEQVAIDLYTTLAENAKTDDIKQVFMEFVGEEIKHKVKLIKVKEEGTFPIEDENIVDLKISDYMMDVKFHPEMKYEDALIFAMKKEKAAFKLYSTLAERAPDVQIKKLFEQLALEESKHKLRFEIEYDEYVLREN